MAETEERQAAAVTPHADTDLNTHAHTHTQINPEDGTDKVQRWREQKERLIVISSARKEGSLQWTT